MGLCKGLSTTRLSSEKISPLSIATENDFKAFFLHLNKYSPNTLSSISTAMEAPK
jgi:hypothetical protein